MSDKDIVKAIVDLITVADSKQIEGSDATTACDLDTFDAIVNLLTRERRLVVIATWAWAPDDTIMRLQD